MPLDIDPRQIKSLSPINSLNPENLRELIRKLSATPIPARRYLFKKGDMEKCHIYLLKGEIEILEGKNVIKTIRAGSAECKQPVMHSLPRPYSARAKVDSVAVKINSDMLDVMLTWDQTGSYSVGVLEEDGKDTDWMTRILQTRAFHRIPPSNIQAMFMHMESVSFKPGEKVIEQDQDGDYFYIIKDGRCMVTRSTQANPGGVRLATLSVGNSFGEEALISNTKRNATVTMLTSGHLMRLNKEDFNSLLNEPLLNWVEYDKARQLVENGAKWLDVRLPTEHRIKHIKESINIALIFLRMKADALDKNTKYVIYCDTGRRSSAASFLLLEYDIESYVLHGGMGTATEQDLTN
ncbi:MAG: cyclic nucleotide-binding domain-containing protein [Gammaproteobacteria bacterium]|nr:cyclic nucleotide-binding domain-containing protein [Gammaproteobacteria bacterium]